MQVWFTDQNYKLLEFEEKINITLVNHERLTYKKWLAIQLNLKIKYLKKVMDFC